MTDHEIRAKALEIATQIIALIDPATRLSMKNGAKESGDDPCCGLYIHHAKTIERCIREGLDSKIHMKPRAEVPN